MMYFALILIIVALSIQLLQTIKDKDFWKHQALMLNKYNNDRSK